MASWRSCVQTENEQDAVDGAAQDRAANDRLASRAFNTVLDYAPVTGQIRAAARWSGAVHYADTEINDPEARYQYSKDRLKAEATDVALLTAGDAVALAAGKLGAAALRSGAGRAIIDRLGTGAQRLCTRLADETGSFNPFAGGGAAEEAGTLSAEQAANLARYARKLPAGAGEPQVVHLADGSVRFISDVPGQVPGSFARYIKTVDASGKTTGYVKETYDPSGALVHAKDKFGSGG